MIGGFLGGEYRRALADLLSHGHMGSEQAGRWRADWKRSLTASTSSRWAGALTRSVLDARATGMRNLYSERRSLRAAVETITARMAAPVGGRTPAASPRARPVRGYRTAAERFEKSRRKAQLQQRLTRVEQRIDACRPRVTVGSGRLWRARQNLGAAGITREQWEQRWADARMFFTADGESGKRGGNETIRVQPDGTVQIKVPAALQAVVGTSRLTLTAPVDPDATHRGGEWADRIATDRAVRYDITVGDNGRWYLDASWGYPAPAMPPVQALREHRTLGVDLNDGHADAAVVDRHGNVIGTPLRFDVDATGSAARRDAQVRHLVTRLIHHAKANGCVSISIENLDFADARAAGRETMGRGRCGKRFRRTVTGLPTARFRQRLVGMCAAAGLWIIAVDPAYTSRWAAQHWRAPLQTSDPAVDGHRAAAVVIGRRGLGHRARRKPVGPRARQRTSTGQPHRTAAGGGRAFWPHRHPTAETARRRRHSGHAKAGAAPPTPFGRQRMNSLTRG